MVICYISYNLKLFELFMKLASVQKIINLQPIQEVDLIEKATIFIYSENTGYSFFTNDEDGDMSGHNELNYARKC